MEKGLIHLYTGEGKGKTTAAVGLAVRAAGAGKRVMFLQFMKGRDTGELHALDQLPGIEILRSKKDFGFYFQMTEEQKEELTRIHNELLEQAVERARQLAEEGQKLSAAAKQAAAESGFSKSEIYRRCLEPEEEDAP